MTHTQTTYTNRIALRAGKKGARPAEVVNAYISPAMDKYLGSLFSLTMVRLLIKEKGKKIIQDC